ncbi:hypothetical protein [Paludisphaera sp.]|uniref:hypothetical protein n=1 Tax=Paludisphaera sp. TaxID=2017432 RepID=UPI00301C336D
MADIGQFLRVLGLVGLPIFAVAVLSIWKPVPSGGEVRPSLSVRVLGTVATTLLCLLTVVGLPFLPYLLWRIWREPRKEAKPLVDRVGWTVFGAGIALMAAMTVYAAAQEGDGSWRPFATIRLHSWIFLGFAALALAGPLGAFLLSRRVAKKPPADDPLA